MPKDKMSKLNISKVKITLKKRKREYNASPFSSFLVRPGKKNTRTTSIQHRINTLYDRYSNNLINSSELLTGLAFVVTKKIK